MNWVRHPVGGNSVTYRFSRWLLGIVLFGSLTAASIGLAEAAGEAGVATGQLTDAQIEKSIPLLTDKEVRQLLISRLKNSESSQQDGGEGFNPAIFVYRLQRT